MKKTFLIIILFLSLVSCRNKEVPTEAQMVTQAKPIPESKIEFNDPAFIAGSNFGNFFISMLRNQQYDMALKFTSKGSIDKFGKNTILAEYEKFSFNYKLSQKSMRKTDNTISLVYSTNEYGTAKLKKIEVVVENDSCKLVMPENIDNLFK